MQRIVCLLSNPKCRCWGGRCENNIGILESLFEILFHERPHLSGLLIVGFIVAGRKRIRSEHDSSLDLRAEPLSAGFSIHVNDPFVISRPVSIPDAVVSGQVRARLCRTNDVVGREGVIGVRKRNLPTLGPPFFKQPNTVLDCFLDVGLHALDEILFGNTNSHPLDISDQGLFEVWDLNIHRSRISGIQSANRVHQDGTVFHIPGDGADLVEGGREGHQTVSRDPTVGWFEPDNSAKRRWLANGASSVRPEGPRALTCCHGCR